MVQEEGEENGKGLTVAGGVIENVPWEAPPAFSPVSKRDPSLKWEGARRPSASMMSRESIRPPKRFQNKFASLQRKAENHGAFSVKKPSFRIA